MIKPGFPPIKPAPFGARVAPALLICPANHWRIAEMDSIEGHLDYSRIPQMPSSASRTLFPLTKAHFGTLRTLVDVSFLLDQTGVFGLLSDGTIVGWENNFSKITVYQTSQFEANALKLDMLSPAAGLMVVATRPYSTDVVRVRLQERRVRVEPAIRVDSDWDAVQTVRSAPAAVHFHCHPSFFTLRAGRQQHVDLVNLNAQPHTGALRADIAPDDVPCLAATNALGPSLLVRVRRTAAKDLVWVAVRGRLQERAAISSCQVRLIYTLSNDILVLFNYRPRRRWAFLNQRDDTYGREESKVELPSTGWDLYYLVRTPNAEGRLTLSLEYIFGRNGFNVRDVALLGDTLWAFETELEENGNAIKPAVDHPTARFVEYKLYRPFTLLSTAFRIYCNRRAENGVEVHYDLFPSTLRPEGYVTRRERLQRRLRSNVRS